MRYHQATFVLLTFGVIPATHSSDLHEDSNMNKYVKVIDGAKSPGEIPEHIRLRIALLSSHAVSDALSDADQSAIMAFLSAERDPASIQMRSAEAQTEIQGLCSEAATMDAVTVAKDQHQIEMRRQAREALRYRDFIDTLSDNAQRALLEYARTVAPIMVTEGRSDLVAFATDHPDMYLDGFNESCADSEKISPAQSASDKTPDLRESSDSPGTFDTVIDSAEEEDSQ